MSTKRKEHIGTIFFKGKHRFIVEAILEYSQDGFVRDVVFLEMHENMQSANIVRIQVESNDLYDITQGAKEMFDLGKILTQQTPKSLGKYKKFTKSEKFSTYLTFGAKLREIAHEKYEIDYFLNMTRNKKTISISFNKFSLQSFIDRVTLLCKRLDNALFDAQAAVYCKREKKKLLKAQNNGETDE